jgi:hypothetical protein
LVCSFFLCSLDSSSCSFSITFNNLFLYFSMISDDWFLLISCFSLII